MTDPAVSPLTSSFCETITNVTTGTNWTDTAAKSTPQSIPSIVLIISLMMSGAVLELVVEKIMANRNSFHEKTKTNNAPLIKP